MHLMFIRDVLLITISIPSVIAIDLNYCRCVEEKHRSRSKLIFAGCVAEGELRMALPTKDDRVVAITGYPVNDNEMDLGDFCVSRRDLINERTKYPSKLYVTDQLDTIEEQIREYSGARSHVSELLNFDQKCSEEVSGVVQYMMNDLWNDNSKEELGKLNVVEPSAPMLEENVDEPQEYQWRNVDHGRNGERYTDRQEAPMSDLNTRKHYEEEKGKIGRW